MNVEMLKVAGAVAGAIGILTALITIVFREIIRKNVFPQLTKKQAYKILLSIIIFSSIIFAVGIYGWLRKDANKTISSAKLIVYLDSIPWKQTSVEIPEMEFLAFTNSVGEIQIPSNARQRNVWLLIGGIYNCEAVIKKGREGKLFLTSQKFKQSEIAGVILSNGKPEGDVKIFTERGDSTQTNDIGQFRLRIRSEIKQDMIYVTYSKGNIIKRVLVQIDQTNLTLDL
jgi:hypothetical protein